MHTGFWRNVGKEENTETSHVNGKIILKWMLERYGLDSSGLRSLPLEGSC
jgi:hypothetical protein